MLALLEDDTVTLEAHPRRRARRPAPSAWLDATLAQHRLVAVTDAMAAAGSVDGRYPWGTMEIEVRDGVAQVAGSTTIAGSTATADRLFRAIAGAEPTDAALLTAVAQTSTNPARVLGRDDLGALAPGARADLVALDSASLRVATVIRAGEQVATG